MKVSDLIKELSIYNQSADITTPVSEDICISYIDNDGEYTKQTTPTVFIEPSDTCALCVWYDKGYCNFYTEETNFIQGCEAFEEKGE